PYAMLTATAPRREAALALCARIPILARLHPPRAGSPVMATATLDVVGIGNAIVDVLANADDAFLGTHGLAKGAMTLIDAARAEALYAVMGPGVEVSGGSAGNT